MEQNPSTLFTTGFVTSKDGTKIGYRQSGKGPGLILVHGGMQAAQNFMTLGALLSDSFTVYIPDRRGRGLSGETGKNYSLVKECEDIEALLYATGAHNIFGLSSGAIIALQCARLFPTIHKAALYEPPLPFPGLRPDLWAKRYEKELSKNKLAEAMVTVIKGTGDSWSIAMLPRFILVPLIRIGIKAESQKQNKEDVPIADLIPTIHYDCLLIKELAGKCGIFKDVKTDLLLMGGTRSKTVLRRSLKALHYLLPTARLLQLPGVGHIAADNNGRPELVAKELQLFFGAPVI